ncbi:DUF3298 and DUF4163 domain-containing protein [Legionella geestiana]|uniref:RsiV family protein n=1 Tax=Legionella geestiana TaxID=45065 RepID=UPI001093103E|nr:RsiV family protein [Legionella geestiana]QDQ39156.1 DUF3298 and DUF4163 domain-containing protein [Legionella geestiana]
MKRFLGILLSLLGMQAGFAAELTSAAGVIREETDAVVISIRYPSALPDKAISVAEKAFVEAQKEDFLKQAATMSMPENPLPGKNGLDIRYRIPFQTKNALSIRYSLSRFFRGSAHPDNTVVTHNYLEGESVTLRELLKPDALPKLANAARELLASHDLSDEEWLKTGSAPVFKNYSRWYFTPDGLAIVFDTYQVAPYVFGPQTVKFSREDIKTWLKPGVARRVWGAHGGV